MCICVSVYGTIDLNRRINFECFFGMKGNLMESVLTCDSGATVSVKGSVSDNN